MEPQTVRLATHADIPTLLQMAYGFHSDALKSLGLGYNPSDYSRFISFLIEGEASTVFVLEQEGVVVGTIAGLISPWFMCHTELTVTEQWVWVEPEARGQGAFDLLLQTLTEWGKGLGATKLNMIAIGSGTEQQVRNFYQKRGFKFAEAHFIKEI